MLCAARQWSRQVVREGRRCELCGCSMGRACSRFCLRPGCVADAQRLWRLAYKARLRNAFVEDVRPSEVFERSGWVCHICGEAIDPGAPVRSAGYPTIDHVLALSRGGLHHATNLRAAHMLCNARKQARLMA